MSTPSREASQFLSHGSFRVRALLAMLQNRWFIRLRWMIAFGAVALLILEHHQFPEFHRPIAVPLSIGLLAVANLIWTILARDLSVDVASDGHVSTTVVRRATGFVNAQMTVDLLILSIILRFSGGVESPMAIFYLFHMVISVLLLTPSNACLQGVWALFLYGGLAIGECTGWLAPHYPFQASTVGLKLHKDWLFVLGSIGILGSGIFGVLFFTRQISRRLDEQERELKQSNEALQLSQIAIHDLQARRLRFMQTAAHQLKSPLAGIETLVGLIRDNVVGPDQVTDVLQRIGDRCRQAIVNVGELLTLARVQGDTPDRHLAARTCTDEIVEAVADRYRESAKSKNIDFQVNLVGGRDTLVAVDSRDLDDCISNLVDNAVKYTLPGGTIAIRASRLPESIGITVADTGMGIAEENVDDLFDPFRRGNLALSSNIPGSGLGLAIVREVVEQAHGRIEVKSVAGRGSEFTLILPLKTGEAALQEPVRDTRVAVLSPPDLPSPDEEGGDG